MRELKLNLKPLIKKLEVFTRKNVFGEFTGEYVSVFKGGGLEFEGYRAYTIQDDANIIDWKASLRAGTLLVRSLIEERNLEVFFLMDISNSMLFSSIPKLKCEYAAELVATLSSAMIQAGDNVGMGLFNENMVKTIPTKSGKRQYFLIVHTLSDPKFYGGNFDFINVLKFITGYLKRNTLLIIVSDFIGLQEEWDKYLKIASHKFEIIGFMIEDPLDLTLPHNVGQVIIEDPFSKKELLIDPDTLREDYEARARSKINKIRDVFTKSGSDLLELRTDEPFVTPIIRFFEKRKRAWR